MGTRELLLCAVWSEMTPFITISSDMIYYNINNNLCYVLIFILTGAGAPQLCRRARTSRKRACATLGAF
jgi:hypothetical protein